MNNFKCNVALGNTVSDSLLSKRILIIKLEYELNILNIYLAH